MAATLTIPFQEGLSIGEQVRSARQRRLRRTVLRRVAVAVCAAAILATAAGVLLRPSDSGWSVSTTDKSASLTMSAASAKGVTFTGHGIAEVTTPALFTHGQRIAIFGGGEPRVVTADDSGRIRFTVDLSSDRPFSFPATAQGTSVREASVTFLPVPNS